LLLNQLAIDLATILIFNAVVKLLAVNL
jgi:hypothetical protein